jgi:CheY-like chemotaxis protein
LATDEVMILVDPRKAVAGFSLQIVDSPDFGRVAVIPSLKTRVFSASREHRDAASLIKQKMKIAIVEDEEALLTAYSDYLQRLGYDSVSTFANGEDLILAISQGKASPDLAIMDYRLPGENGIETAKQAAALRPTMKVVITTADDSVEAEAMKMGLSFLQKPFSLTQLLQTIEHL